MYDANPSRTAFPPARADARNIDRGSRAGNTTLARGDLKRNLRGLAEPQSRGDESTPRCVAPRIMEASAGRTEDPPAGVLRGPGFARGTAISRTNHWVSLLTATSADQSTREVPTRSSPITLDRARVAGTPTRRRLCSGASQPYSIGNGIAEMPLSKHDLLSSRFISAVKALHSDFSWMLLAPTIIGDNAMFDRIALAFCQASESHLLHHDGPHSTGLVQAALANYGRAVELLNRQLTASHGRPCHATAATSFTVAVIDFLVSQGFQDEAGHRPASPTSKC